MKRGIDLFLLMLLAAPAFSQKGEDSVRSRTRVDNVAVSSFVLQGSSGVVTSMAARMFLGGHIGDDLIGNSEKNLGKNGRVGFYQNQELMLTLRNVKPVAPGIPGKIRYFSLSAGLRSWMGASFTEDAFSLMFRGNEPFAGKTADAGGLRYSQLGIRRIGIEYWQEKPVWMRRPGRNKNFYTLGMDLFQVVNFRDIRMPRATLFTEAMGSYIDFSTDLTIRSTGPAPSGLKGSGFGFSFNGQYTFHVKKKRVTAFVRDVGVAFMGDRHFEQKKDTAGRFSGWFVTQQNLGSGSYFSSISDSVNNALNAPKKFAAATVFMPFYVNVNSLLLFNTTRSFSVLADYLFVPGYLPRLRMQYGESVGKRMWLYLSPSLGGFDTWDLGLRFRKGFGKGNSLTLDVPSAEGLLFPKKQHGAGWFVNLNWQIN